MKRKLLTGLEVAAGVSLLTVAGVLLLRRKMSNDYNVHFVDF